MERYMIEKIDGLFYLSFNPRLYRTREGQPERIAAFKTHHEAQEQIDEWHKRTALVQ